MIVDIYKSNVDKDRIDLIIKPETKFEEDILDKHKAEIVKKDLKFSTIARDEANREKYLFLTTNVRI